MIPIFSLMIMTPATNCNTVAILTNTKGVHSITNTPTNNRMKVFIALLSCSDMEFSVSPSIAASFLLIFLPLMYNAKNNKAGIAVEGIIKTEIKK